MSPAQSKSQHNNFPSQAHRMSSTVLYSIALQMKASLWYAF